MKKFEYFNELFRSTGEVFKKPILLLPFIYLFVLSTLFLIFSPTYSDIDLININVLSTAIFLIVVQALLSIIFEGSALITYRYHLANKELNAGQQLLAGFQIYGKLLWLKIIQAIILLVPAIILILILVLIASTEGGIIGSTTTSVMSIFVILYLIYLLIAGIALMFSSVAVSYEKTSAWTAIKKSLSIFKKDTGHSFMAGLMILLYLICYIFIATAITTILGLAMSTGEENIWLEVILSFLILPLGAIVLMYLFKAFQTDKEEVEQEVTKSKTKTQTKPAKTTKKTKKKKK